MPIVKHSTLAARVLLVSSGLLVLSALVVARAEAEEVPDAEGRRGGEVDDDEFA